MNVFVCLSLSLLAALPTPSTAPIHTGPGALDPAKEEAGPDSRTRVSPRSASRRRFNGALVRRRPSARAALASGSPFWLDTPPAPGRWELLPHPWPGLGLLSTSLKLAFPLRPLSPFSTAEH